MKATDKIIPRVTAMVKENNISWQITRLKIEEKNSAIYSITHQEIK